MTTEENLQEILLELQEILKEINTAKTATAFDGSVFYRIVKEKKLFARLRQDQVDGINAKIQSCQSARLPLSHAAYVLATSYHETAQRMLPVREGLAASDQWRRRNLRYYPWYGRGDVQLTWKANYEKADEELGLQGELVKNPDLALDKEVSAKVIVRGMSEGWFSGKIGRASCRERVLASV